MALLRMLLHEAVRRRILSRHPWPPGSVTRLPEPAPVIAYLSSEERARFLDVFDDEEAFRSSQRQRRPPANVIAKEFHSFQASKCFFLAALDTGLSRNDLIALRWEAIDLRENVVRLPRAKSGVLMTIPLTQRLRAALETLPSREGVVFRTRAGSPWSQIMIRRYFARAKAAAGITRPFRFHDLRHDFASNLARAGVSLYVISQLLGHASPRMTARYAHLHPTALREAIAHLEPTTPSGRPTNEEV